MKPDVYLCDLDGTLCNVSHRRQYVATKPKNWEITYDDGTVEIVKCLKEWCKKTDYNFYAIRYAFEKKKPYENILTILALGRVYQK